MKIILNFTTIFLLLGTLNQETEAYQTIAQYTLHPVHTENISDILPENLKSKVYFTGDSISTSVFHNETKQPYQIYHRGPCGKLMWLDSEHPGSLYGICRCINTPLGQRPLTFWQPTNRCYFEYDQGPCDENHWLIRNPETNQVECQRNPCPASKLEKDANIDIESLIELETDYYFVDESDNATCLRNQRELQSWHFNIQKPEVSRFLYHNETQRFFPTGERGPCPPLMVFRRRRYTDLKYGQCNCRNLGAGQRPIAYWQKTDRCYFAFTQGPCESDEWLVGSGNYEVSCQKHKCPITPSVNKEDGEEDQIYKPDGQFIIQDSNGTCYETNTTAFCSGQKKMFLTLTFDQRVIPKCYSLNQKGVPNKLFEEHRSVPNTGKLDCAAGYTEDESGGCVRGIKFD